MRNIETLLGSAVWMAISLVLVFAALEPVDVQARNFHGGQVAAAVCADGAVNPALLCETSAL